MERDRTSTGPPGPSSGGGPGGDAVLKFQLSSLARALPALSFTPLAPPLTVAVYVVASASAAVGSSVAVRVAAS